MLQELLCLENRLFADEFELVRIRFRFRQIEIEPDVLVLVRGAGDNFVVASPVLGADGLRRRCIALSDFLVTVGVDEVADLAPDDSIGAEEHLLEGGVHMSNV